MAGRKVIITLQEEDIQTVERATLDGDEALALGFLTKVVKPQVDAELNRGHCRPVFEWGNSSIKKPPGPPPSGKR